MERSVLHVFLVALLPLSGCGPREALTETSSLQVIQAQSGLDLTSSMKIVAASDGGGRLTGYSEWVIYSASPNVIVIPPLAAHNGACVTNTTAVAVRAVERIAKKPILNAFLAFSSNWESHGLEFQGTLLKTQGGDYLYLRQFKKKR